MTNEQKNQVAAMNASGMSVDEIVIDTGLDKAEVEAFVAERNKKKGKSNPVETGSKRTTITPELRQAVLEWYQSGHSEHQTGRKFGISQSSVHRIVTSAKEKEPASVATETSSEIPSSDDTNSLQTYNITELPKSQTLRGVDMIGVMQSMLIAAEESFGDCAEIMSLKADSDEARIVFRYGGRAYSLNFGTEF